MRSLSKEASAEVGDRWVSCARCIRKKLCCEYSDVDGQEARIPCSDNPSAHWDPNSPAIAIGNENMSLSPLTDLFSLPVTSSPTSMFVWNDHESIVSSPHSTTSSPQPSALWEFNLFPPYLDPDLDFPLPTMQIQSPASASAASPLYSPQAHPSHFPLTSYTPPSLYPTLCDNTPFISTLLRLRSSPYSWHPSPPSDPTLVWGLSDP
ncbi:hypothetical protein C8F01DRAFT_1376815 [Mycena amicta]|nr:hypothetical protein C8F01DRAFT_1376815 [Mycena amicta]